MYKTFKWLRTIEHGWEACATRSGCRYDMARVSSSLLDPVVPSFRALSGRLNFTVRRHEFNQDTLFLHIGPFGLANLAMPGSFSLQNGQIGSTSQTECRLENSAVSPAEAEPRGRGFLALHHSGCATIINLTGCLCVCVRVCVCVCVCLCAVQICHLCSRKQLGLTK